MPRNRNLADLFQQYVEKNQKRQGDQKTRQSPLDKLFRKRTFEEKIRDFTQVEKVANNPDEWQLEYPLPGNNPSDPTSLENDPSAVIILPHMQSLGFDADGSEIIYRGEIEAETVKMAITSILEDYKNDYPATQGWMPFHDLYTAVHNAFKRPEYNSITIPADWLFHLIEKMPNLQFKKRIAEAGELSGFDEETGEVLYESPRQLVITHIRVK